MTVKRAAKTTNVCATCYDGDFQVLFDCVGVEACKYALCHIMPPDGSEECTYREYGSCRSTQAQIAAIELLRNKLSRELRERSQED
jgi:hypothetical protein